MSMTQTEDIFRREFLKKALDIGLIVSTPPLILASQSAKAREDPTLEFLRRSVDVQYLEEGIPRIVSDYGSWKGPTGGSRGKAHEGIDIRGNIGTPILASYNGKARQYTTPEGGLAIIIKPCLSG